MKHALGKERELVQKVLLGDSRAVHRLCRELQPKLMRYAEQRAKSRRDAEELVQDALLSLLDALPLFSFRSSLWTFAVSIVRHEIADYWRKNYAKRIIRALPLVGALYDRVLYSSHETAADLHRGVEQVYLRLKPAYRRILRWKYEENLSVAEIAFRLKLSVKATESQLYRARKVFQETYVALYGRPEFAVLQEK